MKEILHKIASSTMALLVLFSTLSFNVDMHYCGDRLVDYSFFETAESCGMMESPLETSEETSDMQMEMGCCTDIEIVMDGQDDLKITIDQLSFEQQIFVSTFFYAYVNLFEGFDEVTNSFKDYSPPPLIRDITILDQTFLI